MNESEVTALKQYIEQSYRDTVKHIVDNSFDELMHEHDPYIIASHLIVSMRKAKQARDSLSKAAVAE